MENETVTVILPDGSQAERRVVRREMDRETGMSVSVPYTGPNERAERLFDYPEWVIVSAE